MSDAPQALRFRVHGRVQGVSFRAWAVEQARRLGLDGWVRNRADGTVEALAAGPAATLETFAGALRRGPRLARVVRVDVAPADPIEAATGFRQLPTV